jgi:zona occludens toxin
MSITLITGVPGSGKTLYTVSKLLGPIVGSQIPVDDDEGRTVMHTRTVFSNVNGLLLDHELIDANGGWSYKEKVWEFVGNSGGLHDWHEWAQPGSFIVFDEFQKAWPPRPNGSPVPPDVQALDTHRHMGVDFVLLTQNPLNVDRHVLGLVDRHLHIRRVANSAVAIVYEWDHASRSFLYKNAVNRSPWRYDKKAYKLYKSARVHTKQRRTIPGLVWFILLGFAALLFFAPVTYQRIAAKTQPSRPASAPASVPSGAVASASAPGASGHGGGVVAKLEEEAEELVIAGCVKSGPVCRCYDAKAKPLDVEPERCQSEVGESGQITEQNQMAASRIEARPHVTSQADLRFLEAVHGDKLRRVEWGRPGAPS